MILSVVSCKENENITFDGENGQTLAYFKSGNVDLPIILDSTGSAMIVIGTTTISSQDRTVKISIDTDNTDANTSLYSIPSMTAVIPANEYNTTFIINGVYDAILANENRKVTLKLDTVDGGIVSTDKVEITLFQHCPVDDTFFTGMYLIEQTSAYVDGPTLNDGSIVEVTSDGTTRKFSTQNYPDYCNAYMDFEFKLICNDIVVGNQESVCRCTSGTDWFGAPATNSTYSIDDGDSVMYVTFADDAQGDCGTATDTTYKFTKQ